MVKKRLKELQRIERQKEKADRRTERSRVKQETPRAAAEEGGDPDLAGIVPGPQPVLEG